MYANVILAVAEDHLEEQRRRAASRRLVRTAKLAERQPRLRRSASRRPAGVPVHTECS
jgi:hypothetical protein